MSDLYFDTYVATKEASFSLGPKHFSPQQFFKYIFQGAKLNKEFDLFNTSLFFLLILASGDASSQDEEYIKTMKESVSICDAALLKLKQDKRSYWMYSSVLFLALFGTIGSDPYSFFKTGNFVRILFTLLLCYTVFMATVWNNIEVNAIITGKQGMEIIHSKLIHNKQNMNSK